MSKMKASELIEKLQELVDEHGDKDVRLYADDNSRVEYSSLVVSGVDVEIGCYIMSNYEA